MGLGLTCPQRRNECQSRPPAAPARAGGCPLHSKWATAPHQASRLSRAAPVIFMVPPLASLRLFTGLPRRGCSRRPRRAGLRTSAAPEGQQVWGGPGAERGAGLQALLSLPPHLFPSHLFKMENRKGQKQWVGLGGVWQDKAQGLQLAVNKAPEAGGEQGLWVGFQPPEGLKVSAGGRGRSARRRAGCGQHRTWGLTWG